MALAVGILSTGQMGAAIGKVLRQHGADVITCLEGRSEATAARAREAGIREVETLDDVVRQARLVLSVLVPAEAVGLAERLARAAKRTHARPVFAECNAIAPAAVARIAAVMEGAGVHTIDAGIIGPPPNPGQHATRIYCSGPDTGPLLALGGLGLDIRPVGPEIGQASGLKMVYAASTKGTTALWTELMAAARALGLEDALVDEFTLGRAAIARALIGEIPSMPRKSRRWVGEMEEIAATFEALGLTPRMLQGAADMFRLVGGTPLADPAAKRPEPTLDETLNAVVEALPKRAPASAKTS